jgi:hypothetical protein
MSKTDVQARNHVSVYDNLFLPNPRNGQTILAGSQFIQHIQGIQKVRFEGF